MKLSNASFLIVALCSLLSSHHVSAQSANTDNINNLRNVVPPSPNAASLGKYVEWPVNLNTGVPNIDIPLYELKGRSLSVPISISYHASGIKVGEVASWVGIGWSLQAGGVITRSVRGMPDECGGAGYFSTRRSLPDYNYTFEQQANPSATWKGLVKEQSSNLMDGVHDIYYFNALGRSFRFLFKDMGAAGLKIQTIPYSNVDITSTFNSGAVDAVWTVKLEDGTKLIFGGTGYVETTSNPKVAANCGPSFPSSWYLQSITSPVGEKITFKYTSTASVQMNTNITMDDWVGWETAHGNYTGTTSTNRKMETQFVNILNLDSIVSEIGFVKFIPNGTARQDLPGTRALSGISVNSKIQGQVKPVDYFTLITHQSNTATNVNNEYVVSGADYMHWRLVLDAVQHTGVGTNPNIPQWRFTYNSTPLPSTLSFAQDHYGYYNGATSNTSLLPRAYVTSPYANINGFFPSLHEWGNDRSPNGTAMKAGILTEITYPTGGSSQFNYEPNSYVKTQDQLRDTTIYQSLILTYNQTPFTQTKTITFQTTQSQYVSLYISSFISQSIINGFPTASCNVKVTGPNLTQTISVIGNGTQYFDLPTPGTYSFTISTNVNSSNFSTTGESVNIDASLKYTRSLGVLPTTILTGGLCVASIIDKDAIDPTKNIERYFSYSSPTLLDVIDPSTDYITPLSEVGAGSVVTNKYFRNSTTKFALGSGGTTIAYGKVFTKYGLNAQNGQVKTIFFNATDVNNSGMPLGTAPYPDKDTREFERGLLLSETVLDASGNKIKSTFNTYSFLPITQLTFFKALKQAYFIDPNLCTDPLGYCNFLVIRETLSTEQVNKTSTRQVSYLPTATPGVYDSLYSTSNYYFDNASYTKPNRTVTVNEKGQSIVRKSWGLLDANNVASDIVGAKKGTSPIAAMTAANMVDPVLETIETIDAVVNKKTLVNYVNPSGGVIVPDNVLIENGSDTSKLEKRVMFKYDAYFNLKEQNKISDMNHAYIYDYNSNYPIAEVVNGLYADIAFTSFESNGLGNWTKSGTTSVDGVNSFTGNKSLLMTGATLTKLQLVTTNTYIVSFWAKSGATGILVNGTAPTSYGNRNGWNYFEKEISGVTSAAITGTGNFDEVRLYPKGSLMTTYTYDPLIGVTSITDANNVTTFYEYDGLGRLIIVRDDKKKVLKVNQYHYKQ